MPRIEKRVSDLISFLYYALGRVKIYVSLSEDLYTVEFEKYSNCGNEYWSSEDFETLDEIEDWLIKYILGDV